ncbi:ECF RNA polymerase sigma-E factor [Enhygromyxa salina]|uniref:ECF RNA polymerase sigma-E factor n=2 Tax=Enhygromyxa salina TaxID=215803 RepID=A0A2S9YRR7_9BACT|nr:ECF RNA polymerase sigma-E factor [Enhygromyxa salina]
MTDLELFDAWMVGDRRAADELFERHYEAIDRFFRNKVVQGSEDLVQKTLTACVEVHERFRGEASFRTYLFAIAHNVLRAHYRARRRESSRLEFTEISAEDLAPGPSTMVRARREQQLLLESLRQIPLDYQVVLELYYWEELSGSAIAKIIGLRENTVRSRIRKGKLLLEKKMKALALTPEEYRSTIEDLEAWARSIHAGGEPPAGDSDGETPGEDPD